MKKNITALFILLLCVTLCFSMFLTKTATYAASYNLTEAEALVQYAWPHTNQLRKYVEATPEQIAADEAKTEKELFEYNGKKYAIYGTRKYSYFFAIVSNTGAYLEYEKNSDGSPKYVKVAKDNDGKNILDSAGNNTYVDVEAGEQGIVKFTAYFNNNYLTADERDIAENIESNDWFNSIFYSILDLINGIFVPLIIIIGSVGTIFVIVVSVRLSRAETGEERDKQKKHLISIIIAFVFTIMLMIIAQLFSGNANGIMGFINQLTS